ncbi:MAG: hypothetical protein AMXMBFR66_05200 [Pseudomonadota bacterium]
MQLESLNDALIECVKAIGGSKVAGIALWPAKGVEAAQRHLLACLNPERNEKLGPDEVLHVLRLARERGCHVGMQYLAVALSYAEPVPVEPKDEADELRRQVLAMGQSLQRALSRIEQLERPSPRAVA